MRKEEIVEISAFLAPKSATAKSSSPLSCIPTMTRRASARQQPCSTTASSRKQSLHHLQQERRLRLHNKPSLSSP